MNRTYVLTRFETIGTCEDCGATDHHLIEGLCPVCRPKTVTVETESLKAPQHVDCDRSCVNFLKVSELYLIEQGGRVSIPVRPLFRLSDSDSEEVPLGAEADVSHVRRPRGAR